MSRRIARAEKELRNVIASYLLTGLKRPLEDMSSISRVEVSPDLRHARVFIRFIGDNCDSKENIEILHSQAYEIQNFIARSLPMKFCPKIKFVQDSGVDHSIKIESILADLKKQREEQC